MKQSRTFGRPLAALLALCLAVGQLPAAAHAEEETSDYAQEVFALLEDPQADVITIQEDVEVKVEGRYYCYVNGSEDREKVLDLNGHTVTLDGLYNLANWRITDLAGGGKLVLTSTLYNQRGSLTLSGVDVVRADRPRGGGTAICNYWQGTLHLISSSVDATQVQYAIENNGGICVIDGGEVRSGDTAIVSRFGTQLYGVSGQDEDGNWFGTTGTHWYDGALTINGGLIEGDLALYDTDVTITGGVIRGEIVTSRSFEYEDGHSIKLDTPIEMQYCNADGDAVTLPKPTYELHEENGEMKRGYWDVPMDAWFYAPVQALMDDRVLDYGGYSDKGSFGPAEPLTRGQAAALLARACGAETEDEVTEPPFLDVSDTTPYAKYINAGQRLGLLSGDGQGQFHPESAITRQEFAVLVMNAANKYGLALPAEPKEVSFRDGDAIAPWARDAVAQGAACGLWNGTDSGDFLPLAPITRAEGATILARLMQAKGIC